MPATLLILPFWWINTAAMRCGYYLMRDIAMGHDADFSESRLLLRYNADLANDLGNLLNRSLNMIQKYRAGKLSRPGDATENRAHPQCRRKCLALYVERFDEFQIQSGLDAVWSLISTCNAFIDASAPWKLANSLTNPVNLIPSSTIWRSRCASSPSWFHPCSQARPWQCLGS